MKKRLIITTILFYSLMYYAIGQGISYQLDSIHQLTGSNYEKIHSYDQLLSHWENEKNYTQLGYDAHQLAKWIHKEKKWFEAIRIVQIAYRARKKATPFNTELLKRSYYNYAIYNYRYKNYSKSIIFFEKVLTVDDSIFLRGRAYDVIGDCYKNLGDFYKSIEYQKKALKNHVQKDIDKGYLIVGHINIAVTYGLIRSKESSKLGLEHLKKAEELFHQQEHLGAYHLYLIKNGMGNFYCEGVDTIDLSKCLASYKEALQALNQIHHPEKLPTVHYNLGLTYIEIDSTKATHHFNQSLNYVEYDFPIKPLISLGRGFKELHYKNYDVAQRHFSQSLADYFSKKETDIHWLPTKEKMKQISNPDKFLELLSLKLRAWIGMAKQENNHLYYTEAIKTAYTCDEFVSLILEKNFSQNTKLVWRDVASQIYLIVQEACLKINNYDDAFYFMEKGKALLLLQDLEKNNDKLPPHIMEKNQKLNNKIISLKIEISSSHKTHQDSLERLLLSTEIKLRNYQDSLTTIFPEYFTKTSIPKTIKLSSLELSVNEALLEYNMGVRLAGEASEAYGIFVTNTQKKLFKIEEVDSLKKKIYVLRDMLHTPFKTKEDIDTYQLLAHEVYTALFPKEIRDKINGKKITIATDNILHYLPFEALITDTKNKTYLIEKTQIHYTHSLSFDRMSSKINRNAELDFLGMAPVEFNGHLTRLPKSKNELSLANQFYKGNLLLNDQATKKEFRARANKYKILHLATHADASDSLNPWIAFKKDKLTILEVGSIRNQADLVVLSGCETSLGEVIQGEGVLSLARGFFRSGAKSVIPSLWSTNDKATAIITSDFYKYLSEGQTKSEALRTAKLNYLKNNTDAEASPHYWAPLILIGDNGTLLPQSSNLWYLWIGLGILLVFILFYGIYTLKKK